MEPKPLAELLNLSGKTAIVTGGAMGIGLGIAYRLAEAGAQVVIVDMDDAAGKAAAHTLVQNGWKAAFVKADVSEESDVTQALAFALKTFGDVDVLVNNAGIYPNIPLMKMSVENFKKIMAVNVRSAFMFTKAVAEVLIQKGKGGKIINITSIDALHPSSVGLATYDASKHALWGFTKNIALELAPHHIYVNAIAPGAVDTPGIHAGAPARDGEAMMQRFIARIPMQRVGEADDIGKVALFLASDMSSYMTGAQIVVDGGVLLS
ncbi:MAG: SDR family oxidoreductase [bacterium]|nr:SDR family oxidoreductase [bacterium]